MIKILSSIDNYGRWILLVLMVFFIISGFGMTRGFMDRHLAKEIHEDILPIPFFILFAIHIVLPLRAQLTRWKIFKSQTVTDLYAYALCLIFLGICFWLFMG